MLDSLSKGVYTSNHYLRHDRQKKLKRKWGLEQTHI